MNSKDEVTNYLNNLTDIKTTNSHHERRLHHNNLYKRLRHDSRYMPTPTGHVAYA